MKKINPALLVPSNYVPLKGEEFEVVPTGPWYTYYVQHKPSGTKSQTTNQAAAYYSRSGAKNCTTKAVMIGAIAEVCHKLNGYLTYDELIPLLARYQQASGNSGRLYSPKATGIQTLIRWCCDYYCQLGVAHAEENPMRKWYFDRAEFIRTSFCTDKLRIVSDAPWVG